MLKTFCLIISFLITLLITLIHILIVLTVGMLIKNVTEMKLIFNINKY